MDIPGITPEFLEKYQALCKSPLRTTEQITEDLRQLVLLPHVQYVDFWKPAYGNSSDTFMVGTDLVKIKNDFTNRDHAIGEFIIFLTRRRNGRAWDVSYRLANIYSWNQEPKIPRGCMHPHLQTTDDTELGVEIANLCIQAGFYAIYQHIRRGELAAATQLIVTLLHHHEKDKTFPRAELWQWPLAEESQS